MPAIGPLGPGTPPPLPAPGGVHPLPGLRLGELVDAELLEALTSRDGILSIGGKVFRAVHPEGLVPGHRLQLRLVSLGPPPVFKLPGGGDEGVARLLLPPAQGLAGAVRALLEAPDVPGDGGLGTALRHLLQLPEEPGSLAQALARLVRGSGVHHEADLARGQAPEDLKGLALRLLARQPEGPLARAAEALVGHVEAHQARSALEGAVVVPFVLPWGEEWAQGELRLDRDSGPRNPGEPSGGRVRLRLQMPRLGPVEVSLRWGASGVSVRFGFEAPALAEARGRLGDLSRRLLADAGVRVAELRAEPLEPPAPRGAPGLVEVVA